MSRHRTPTLSLSQRRALEGFSFVAPWIVGFGVFFAWPMFYSLFLAFQRVNPAGFRTQFIGLHNFTRAFVVDINFVPILLETLRDVLLETPIILAFSLAVAVLLNRKMGGQALLRAVFFLPVVISSGYVIQELFGQGVGGLSVVLGVEGASEAISATGQVAATAAVAPEAPNIVNISAFLNQFLGGEIAQGINEFLNRLGLTLWRSGIQILLFIAGLQGISTALYEAGRIDGANEWTLFWMVTLPMISPIILAVIIFTVVDSFMDVFNRMLHYIRSTAFDQRNFGYSAAIAWLYFLVVFVLILIVLGLLRKRVFYQGERS